LSAFGVPFIITFYMDNLFEKAAPVSNEQADASKEREMKEFTESGEDQARTLKGMVESGEIKDEAAVEAARAIAQGTLRIIRGEDKAE